MWKVKPLNTAIWSYYLFFKGAFQICLCKGTSVQARQLSKFPHLSGCPNSYIVIHHLPPKLRMTRKFMREKWSYLTPSHGQYSSVTANSSNSFPPSPFLRLTNGEIHKDTKILAPMQSLVKRCSFQQNQAFTPYLQATWHLSPPQILIQSVAIAWKKRHGFACFQLQQSSNWEVT